jgi:hypothetical protein
MGMQVIEEMNLTRRVHPNGPLPSVELAGDPPNHIRTAPPKAEEESWMVDESWTAIVGYMAELALPGEG